MSARDDFGSSQGRGLSRGGVADLENGGVAGRRRKRVTATGKPVTAAPASAPPPAPIPIPTPRPVQVHPYQGGPTDYWPTDPTQLHIASRSKRLQAFNSAQANGYDNSPYYAPTAGMGPLPYDPNYSPPVDHRTGKYIQFPRYTYPGGLLD